LIMLLLSIVVQFITEYKYKKEEDVNYRILQGTLLTSIFGMFLHSCLVNSGYRHNRPVVKGNDGTGSKPGLFYRLNELKPFNTNPIVMTVFVLCNYDNAGIIRGRFKF